MDQKELIQEIKKLREEIDNLAKRYNTLNMFVGGMLRGAGILVGATMLVLVGGTILNLLGFLPGLSDIVQVILDAFEQASLQ